MGNIIINVCASQKWPVTMWGCLATLVSTHAWREGLMASSECAVTRDRTSCNSLDGSEGVLVTEVRSYTQYDGASFGYAEVGDWICCHIACCGVIGWWRGASYVCRGIIYICFVTRRFPVTWTGTKYQHKKYPCVKYCFKTTQILENPCRVRPRDRTTNIDEAGIGLHSRFSLLSQLLWRPWGVMNATNRELLGVHWKKCSEVEKVYSGGQRDAQACPKVHVILLSQLYRVSWNVGLILTY